MTDATRGIDLSADGSPAANEGMTETWERLEASLAGG